MYEDLNGWVHYIKVAVIYCKAFFFFFSSSIFEGLRIGNF